MSTKAPAGIKYFDEGDTIKKLYSAIDELKDAVPANNDRNRLSFCLNMFLNKEAESVADAIQQAKPGSATVEFKVLEEIISKKLKEKGLL
jgi:hypothetical protein